VAALTSRAFPALLRQARPGPPVCCSMDIIPENQVMKVAIPKPVPRPAQDAEQESSEELALSPSWLSRGPSAFLDERRRRGCLVQASTSRPAEQVRAPCAAGAEVGSLCPRLPAAAPGRRGACLPPRVGRSGGRRRGWDSSACGLMPARRLALVLEATAVFCVAACQTEPAAGGKRSACAALSHGCVTSAP